MMQTDELLDLCRRLIVLKVAGVAADTPDLDSAAWPKFSFQELKQLVDIALYIETKGIESVAEMTGGPFVGYGTAIARPMGPSGFETAIEGMTQALSGMAEGRRGPSIIDLISSLNLLPNDDPLRPRLAKLLETKLALAETHLREGGNSGKDLHPELPGGRPPGSD
jgi:hypothetical protein